MSDIRDKFEAWWFSDKVISPALITEHSMYFAEQGYKACAEAMKDEIDKRDTVIAKIDFELRGVNSLLDSAQFVLAEADTKNARIAQLEEALRVAQDVMDDNHAGLMIVDEALAESSDTWLAEHDKEVEVKVLEEAAKEIRAGIWHTESECDSYDNGKYCAVNIVGRLAESRRTK